MSQTASLFLIFGLTIVGILLICAIAVYGRKP